MRTLFTLRAKLFLVLMLFGAWQASAQTYTFTTGGATGINGPTQAQINTAYSGTSLASAVTVTNGIQEWSVPVGGTYRIEVYGAQGFGKFGSYDLGGRGAYLSGEFTFQPGDKIKVLVGQEGGCCHSSGTNQAGGGGGTFVVDENDSALIIAGGGGGAGFQYNTNYFMTTYNPAGDANVTTAGKTAASTTTSGTLGAGGINGNGGVNGSTGGAGGGFYTDGVSGVQCGVAFLNGGAGGNGTSSIGGFGGGGGTSGQNNIRAGGGGGYSGGGSAGTATANALIGGGGGSYNSGLNQKDSVGVGYGDGKVIITLVAPAVMVPNNVGAMGFADLPSGICIGTLPIKVNVKNFGNNRVDSVMVTWEVNGTVQGSSWYQVNLDTLLSANDETTVTVGNYNFSTYGSVYNIRAWTSLPNNVADTVNNNDTTTTVVGTQLSGTFTVNSLQATGGTNFGSFSALTNALTSYGVCGPVTVNVSPGTYTEQVKFGDIPGASATNTIRINGNGATVQFSGTSTANMHLLTFDGTKYVTIDSLTFKSLGTTYAWGAFITNGSEYDSLIRCTFDLTSVSGTGSANSNGIVFSGSSTSPTTAGENGSNIYIGYSKVLGRTASGGPYYGLVMYGTSGQGQNSGNVIEHNEFSNFYYYGMYLYYCGDDNKILYNDINRQTKTSVTIFYGIYTYQLGGGTHIIGNRIHDPYGSTANSTSSCYGLYAYYLIGTAAKPNFVNNNAVYNMNMNIMNSSYFYYCQYTEFAHNTIVNNKTTTSASVHYGLYTGYGSNNTIKNNNIVITGGGTGDKYGIYHVSPPTGVVSGNNVYVNTTQAGNANYAYVNGTAYATQAAFQAANPTIDAGSPSVDPLFNNIATGDLSPGNPLLLTSRLSNITTDINGVSRNSNTGIGAFEIFPTGQNNAGTIAILGPDTAFCPGTKQIYAVVYNAGSNNINRLTINWQVGATTQTPVTYTQTLVPMTATSGKNIDTVLLGSIAISNTANSDIRVWTSNPNNTVDPVPANDEARTSFRAAMSGTYTVNSGAAASATNFRSFAELTSALDMGGVCGPVIVNVTPATYSEKVVFGEIKGASFTNTIRINGNGAIVRKTTASTSDLPILTLDGTKHLTIDSLTFNTSNASYGWGALITGGAQYDSIIRCEFDLSNMTASSSTYSNGIVFSASPTSPTTQGENGSDIYIGYNKILGNPTNMYSVYYGIVMYGTNGQNHNANNVIEHNTIQDFYMYGTNFYGATNLTFRYNEIHKKNKTAITGTTYGMYLYYLGEGSQIIGNRIHTLGGTLATPNATTTYPIYCYYSQGTTTNPVLVANNAVYNMNKMVVSGAHLYYNNNLKFYHNTISIDVPVTSTTVQQGIYAYTSSASYTGLDIKNNIISITEGNTGVKYGIYYSSPSYIGESEMNNIYVNSSQIGTQNYMYLNAAYATRAAYKASTYGSQYEINSPAVNPLFNNLATGDLRPLNDTIIGAGEPLNNIVPIDINEQVRSNPPTIGAFREAPQGNNNAGTMAFANPTLTSCAGTQSVKAIIYNGGNNNITSLRVNWSINGTTQTQYTYTGTLVPFGASGRSVDTVTLGNVTLSTSTTNVVRVWTSLPNNTTDPVNTNDTNQEAFTAAMGGVYTINRNAAASATNYQSFSDIIADLEDYGVCAPVTVNVVAGSGPYTDRLVFTEIPGASQTNTVRFNGNGQVVQHNATATTTMHNVVFDGASYITLDSIYFKSLATAYGVGAFVTNGSSYDSIIRCTFDMTTITSASTYNVGIMFSASPTSYSSAGINGTNMYIGYNKILGRTNGSGLYSGLTMYGSAALQNSYNIVEHNEFANFYVYGIYTYYGIYNKLRYNDLHRKDKTTVSTFYGFYGNYFGEGSEINGNHIHDTYGSTTTTTTSYGVYSINIRGLVANPAIIANNAIYNFNTHMSGGIYLSSGNYPRIYHNTIVNNLTTTSTTVSYGIYTNVTTGEIKNNTISFTGGSMGDKYGLYYNTTTMAASDNNNIYMNSSQNGNLNYGYMNAKPYPTQNDFINDFPSYENNSLTVDPDFTNVTLGDLTPNNTMLVGAGENLTMLVPEDIKGQTRSLRPTIGAVEIPPVGNNNAAIVMFTEPIGAYCSDTQMVKILVSNVGWNNITSLSAGWKVNGVTQPSVTYSGLLASLNSLSGSNTDTILLGKVRFSQSASTTIEAWTFNPNGQNDPVKSNDTISETFQAPKIKAVAVMDEICPGGDADLELDPAYGYTGKITWQYSDNNTTWTDVPTANATEYTQTNVPHDRWYRIKLDDGKGCYSEAAKVIVAGVQMAQVIDDTSCGTGAMVLTAIPTHPNVRTFWYDSQTSTTPIDTGTTFTTPSLTASMTYWVQAERLVASKSDDIGNGTSYLSGTDMPFYSAYEGHKGQYLYTAAELLAKGFTPGNITSLGFYMNTMSSSNALENFEVKIGTTNLTALTTASWETVTTVFSSTAHTLTASSLNTFNFSQPFYWDGTSNIVVEVCWANSSGRGPGGSVSTRYSNPGFTASHAQYANGAGASFCTTPSGTNTSSGNRPDIKFSIETYCIGDRVPVEALVFPATLNVDLGNDSVMCTTSFAHTLDAKNAIPGVTYTWNTGASTRTINTTNPGTYSVKVVDSNGCYGMDTILIQQDPVIKVLNDTVELCDGLVTTLNAGNNGSTYLWSNNDTTRTSSEKNGGHHYVRVTTPLGCVEYDTTFIDILPLPVVNLGIDTIMCTHDSIRLDAGNQGVAYDWSTGASGNRYIWAPVTNSYSVKVTDAKGCINYDTIAINTAPMPQANFGRYESLCDGKATEFDAGNPGSTYLWSTNETTRYKTINNAGTFWVYMLNQYGCYGTDTVTISVNPNPPTFTIGRDTSYCDGEYVTLKIGNTDPTAITTWQDNSTGDTINALVTDKYVGTVTNIHGCSVSDSVDITVFDLPAYFNLGNDTGICDEEVVYLKVGNTDPNATVVWNDNSTNDTMNVTNSGFYYATVTNSNGCIRSDSIQIDVHGLPQGVTLGSGDTAVCDGTIVMLQTQNNDPNATFRWNDGSNNRVLNVDTTGEYYVTVFSSFGCIASDTMDVIVNPNPPAFNLGNDTAFCEGNILRLRTRNTDPGATVLWSDNSTGDNMDASTTGNHWATITNRHGCRTSDSIYIEVWPKPIVELGNDTSICNGDRMILSVPATNSDNVRWQDGSNAHSFIVTKAGTYSVTVTSQYGCVNTGQIKVTVRPYPSVTGISSSYSPWTRSFTFTAQNVTATDSLEWNFGDGNTSKQISPVHSYRTPGIYIVSLRLMNDCGDYIATKEVDFIKVGIDGQTVSDNQLKLYPNPAKDMVRLRNESTVPMESITVYNNLGQIIYQSKTESAQEYELDVRGLASGMYNVKVVMENGTSVHRKFEISR